MPGRVWSTSNATMHYENNTYSTEGSRVISDVFVTTAFAVVIGRPSSFSAHFSIAPSLLRRNWYSTCSALSSKYPPFKYLARSDSSNNGR